MYSYSILYSIHCLYCSNYIAGILDTMIDTEIARFMKRLRLKYAPPTVISVLFFHNYDDTVEVPSPPLPIVHTDSPLLDEAKTAQICNKNCSTDEDETYQIKDIMTQSPLPSIRCDNIDFDEMF